MEYVPSNISQAANYMANLKQKFDTLMRKQIGEIRLLKEYSANYPEEDAFLSTLSECASDAVKNRNNQSYFDFTIPSDSFYQTIIEAHQQNN
jgi:hypothetical protein